MTIRKSIRVERAPEISFRVFCESISEWWPGGFGGKDAKLFMEGGLAGGSTNGERTARNTKSGK